MYERERERVSEIWGRKTEREKRTKKIEVVIYFMSGGITVVF